MPEAVRPLSALKITAASYETYLALPKPGRFPLNLPAVNHCFLVYDPSLPDGPWGFFDERDFRKFYAFEGKVRADMMTPVRKLPEID